MLLLAEHAFAKRISTPHRYPTHNISFLFTLSHGPRYWKSATCLLTRPFLEFNWPCLLYVTHNICLVVLMCNPICLAAPFTLRSSHRRYSVKKGVLRNLAKFTGKHLSPAALLKKRLWHRCFPVNFVKFLRTPFFTEHLWWLLLYIIDYNESKGKNEKWIT